MNFLNALTSHAVWKTKLESYLKGESKEKLSTEEISSPDNCELGQWLNGNSDHFSQSSNYSKVCDNHKEFHNIAADIIKLAKADNIPLAEIMFHERFSKLSHELQFNIRKLANDLK